MYLRILEICNLISVFTCFRLQEMSVWWSFPSPFFFFFFPSPTFNSTLCIFPDQFDPLQGSATLFLQEAWLEWVSAGSLWQVSEIFTFSLPDFGICLIKREVFYGILFCSCGFSFLQKVIKFFNKYVDDHFLLWRCCENWVEGVPRDNGIVPLFPQIIFVLPWFI